VDCGLGTVVEDEVVALAVSPGLGDGEAALAGLVEEGGFGTLSGALGVGAVGVVGAAGVLRPRGLISGEQKGGASGLRLTLRSFLGKSLSFILTLGCKGAGCGGEWIGVLKPLPQSTQGNTG
jgi:hypothetical protein